MIWLYFSAWVLKRLVTHYKKPTTTYFLWGVYLPQPWSASRVSGSALQLQGKPVPFASSHIWCTVLFPNVPKGKYTVCTKEGPAVDASTSQGLRRSLRKTRVIIGDSNDESEYQRRGEVSGREKCWLRLRSSYLCCRRKQRQWLALYEAFSQKSTTTLAWLFEKTHSWSFFWHSHIVMTIILCQLLSSQIGHCRTAYFSHLVSSMFLCCFWLIDSFVFVRLWIGTLGDEGYRIGASPQTNTIDQDNSTAFQDDWTIPLEDCLIITEKLTQCYETVPRKKTISHMFINLGNIQEYNTERI